MIQIATVGDAQIVVKEGLRKVPSEKLYILHTENTRSESKFNQDLKKAKSKEEKDLIQTKQYKTNADKLKNEIVDEFGIKVELHKVGKYDTYDVIREIQKIISKEKTKDPKLQGDDFAINITGGTKAMVAGAACSAYLAQTKMYYVLEYHEAKKGKDLVIELPVLPTVQRLNTPKSNDTTSSIILREIWKLGPPTTYQKLRDHMKKISVKVEKKKFEKQTKKQKEIHSAEIVTKTITKKIEPNLLNYHLNKLEGKYITRKPAKEVDRKIVEKVYEIEDAKEIKKICNNSNNIIIDLTEAGHLFATYPETLGFVI